MTKVLFVGIGGFIGASLRYVITSIANTFFITNFPIGTLLVNFIASFLIGFILQGSFVIWNLNEGTKLLLTTGLLGGLSTFSTFSYETVSLFSSNASLFAVLNIMFNVSLCLLGVLLGKHLINIIY